jgi:hypothetical protein
VCAISAGLIVVAWAGSGWYFIMWSRNSSFPRCSLTLTRGAIAGRIGELPAAALYAIDDGVYGPYRTPEPVTVKGQGWLWVPRYSSMSAWSDVELPAQVTLPLWLPTLVFAVPAAWMWRVDVKRRRAVREGCCATCGYSLVGTPAERPCPECGTSVAPKPDQS